jgi:hypothetical protein
VSQIDSTTVLPGESLSFEVSFTPEILYMEYIDTVTVELYYGDDLHLPLYGQCGTGGVNDNPHLPNDFLMSVYPNPLNNQLKITVDDRQRGGTIRIFDIYGRQVDRLEPSNSTRELYWKPDHLAGGLYFIQYKTERYADTQKIVYLK